MTGRLTSTTNRRDSFITLTHGKLHEKSIIIPIGCIHAMARRRYLATPSVSMLMFVHHTQPFSSGVYCRTGESRWVAPTSSFPEVKLSRAEKRKAEEKQREYRKTVAKSSDIAGTKKGVFGAGFGGENDEKGSDDTASTAVAEKQREKWFDFLAAPAQENKEAAEPTATIEEVSENVVAEEKDVGDDWLSWLTGPKDVKKSVANPVDSAVEEEAVDVSPAEEKRADWLKAIRGKTAPGATKATSVNGDASIEESPTIAGTETSPKGTVEIEPEPTGSKPSFLGRLFEVAPPIEKFEPQFSSVVLPDPKKILWGGEDAVFIKGKTFGVFDGVSGASKLDGLPLYSKTLAEEMKKSIGEEPLEIKDMIAQLERAVEVANQKATGASTAIVGSIADDGFLRVLNVGDSTCVVIRDGRVVSRSQEINHFYECPYQFSEISPDKPRDGRKMNYQLKKGDLIVMGSDGIFDNLPNEEIVSVAASSPKNPSAIAKSISDRARKVSLDDTVETPFSKMALRNKNPDYPDGLGGKVDDISCVAVLCE